MAKADFKPEGLQFTIHQDTFSTKTSKCYKNEPGANCSCGFRIKGDVEERGNKENSAYSRGIYEQLVPLGKKDEGYRPIINLKMLNQFVPFLHFIIEGLSQSKHLKVTKGCKALKDYKTAFCHKVALDV